MNYYYGVILFVLKAIAIWGGRRDSWVTSKTFPIPMTSKCIIKNSEPCRGKICRCVQYVLCKQSCSSWVWMQDLGREMRCSEPGYSMCSALISVYSMPLACYLQIMDLSSILVSQKFPVLLKKKKSTSIIIAIKNKTSSIFVNWSGQVLTPYCGALWWRSWVSLGEEHQPQNLANVVDLLNGLR